MEKSNLKFHRRWGIWSCQCQQHCRGGSRDGGAKAKPMQGKVRAGLSAGLGRLRWDRTEYSTSVLLVPHMGIGQSIAQAWGGGFFVTLSPRRSGLFLAGALRTRCSGRPFFGSWGGCESKISWMNWAPLLVLPIKLEQIRCPRRGTDDTQLETLRLNIVGLFLLCWWCSCDLFCSGGFVVLPFTFTLLHTFAHMWQLNKHISKITHYLTTEPKTGPHPDHLVTL